MATVRELAIEVLRERGEPLHWRRVADEVLKRKRLRGKTPLMTISATLSSGKEFKRVIRRGIYALREWDQYPELRWVKDIAYETLKDAGRPLRLSEIVSAVVAERELKENAMSIIRGALIQDGRIVQVERGLFSLATSND